MSEPVTQLVITQESTEVVVSKTFYDLELSARGPQGIQGPQGVPGSAGGSVIEFHTNDPAGTWSITHNLNRLVFVSVVDEVGEGVLADIDQSDPNTVSIRFATPTAGKAVVS